MKELDLGKQFYKSNWTDEQAKELGDIVDNSTTISYVFTEEELNKYVKKQLKKQIKKFKAKMPKEEEEGFLESYGWTKGYNQALKEVNKILNSL